MNRLRQLVHEAHRRSLWQVLAVYLVGSYVALEVIGNVNDVFGLPDWVPAAALILFILGLPIVLATAFVQEGAPDRDDFRRSSEGVPGLQSTTEAAFDPEPAAAPGAQRGAPMPDAASAQAQRAGSRAPFLERHLTWRRSLLAGLAAFILLATATALWAVMRQAGIGPVGTLLARGVMTESDRVLLADFASAADDSLIARAVTEALRVDLERSDVVQTVEPAAVRRGLELMGREPGVPLYANLARELAVREGIEAVLVGQVNRLGEAYVVTARLLSAADEVALASFRESADDAAGVVDAVDRLSEQLRERVGESLRSIRQSPPLERVTTHSLEALEKYSQAARIIAVEPESRQATTLLRQAVAIDSTFAMAHRLLAISYGMTGEPGPPAQEALRIAYRHRDRLTDRERLLTTADYLRMFEGDVQGAHEVLRTLVEQRPDDAEAHRELAATYADLRQREAAERHARRAVELDSLNALNHDVLVNSLASRGRYQEALAALEREARLFPADSLWHRFVRAGLSYRLGRPDDLTDLARRLAATPANPLWKSNGHMLLASLALLQGRVREANREAALGFRSAPWAEGMRDVGTEMDAAYTRWVVGIDTVDSARRVVAAARSIDPAALRMDPQRPLRMAETVARVGATDLAREFISAWERQTEPGERGGARLQLLQARARVEIAQGHPEQALATLREMDALPSHCRCALDEMAEVFALLGQADSAAAYYRRFLEEPGVQMLDEHAYDRAPALRFLAGYHDDRGEDSLAVRYYAEFADQWRNADPELQPQVRAARTRIATLTRE